MTIDFRSDNTLGGSPEIAEALARANAGRLTSYGGDEITARMRRRCAEVFETEVEVYPVLSGTAGNALAIACTTPPFGAVFCHDEAHIHLEEFGAVEFFSGGAKLMPIRGEHGKLSASSLTDAVAEARRNRVGIPSCVSVTNATEAGTVYSIDELHAICDAARGAGLRVHMGLSLIHI